MIDPNAVKTDGLTIINTAAMFTSHPEVMQILCEAGVDIRKGDKAGLSALSFTAKFNPNPDVINKMILLGARVDGLQGVAGVTPLINAAMFTTNPEVIVVLMVAGADAKRVDSDGKRALVYIQNNERLMWGLMLRILSKKPHRFRLAGIWISTD